MATRMWFGSFDEGKGYGTVWLDNKPLTAPTWEDVEGIAEEAGINMEAGDGTVVFDNADTWPDWPGHEEPE